MTNETEKKEDTQTEYFDQCQPDREQANSHRDTRAEETKPFTIRNLLEAQENDRACTHAGQSIGLSKSIFTVNTEGERVGDSTIDGISQPYIPTTL